MLVVNFMVVKAFRGVGILVLRASTRNTITHISQVFQPLDLAVGYIAMADLPLTQSYLLLAKVLHHYCLRLGRPNYLPRETYLHRSENRRSTLI